MIDYYGRKLKLAQMELEMVDASIVATAHMMTAETSSLTADEIFEKLEDFREVRENIKNDIAYYSAELKKTENEGTEVEQPRESETTD